MSRVLAEGLVAAGHEVMVITGTSAREPDQFDFSILRNPDYRSLINATSWCDVLLQNNVSLRMAWQLLFVRRPWVVAHQTWLARTDGTVAWQDRLKKWLLRRYSVGVSISNAIAAQFDHPTALIGNTYQSLVFSEDSSAKRDLDLVFLGRLVSDKGPALPLEALARMRARGLNPTLTFIGSGPELAALKARTQELGVASQVRFTGPMTGVALAAELNRHKVMVVPSLWKEPFGIVALEGAACGCAVVGSEGGGLKDAIGPCGVTFPNGDVEALTLELTKLLASTEYLGTFRLKAAAHLYEHSSEVVVGKYLAVLQGAVGGRRRDQVATRTAI